MANDKAQKLIKSKYINSLFKAFFYYWLVSIYVWFQFKSDPDADMWLLTHLHSVARFGAAPWLQVWHKTAHQHLCNIEHRDWKQTHSGEKWDICGVLLPFKHIKSPSNVSRVDASPETRCLEGKGGMGCGRKRLMKNDGGGGKTA